MRLPPIKEMTLDQFMALDKSIQKQSPPKKMTPRQYRRYSHWHFGQLVKVKSEPLEFFICGCMERGLKEAEPYFKHSDILGGKQIRQSEAFRNGCIASELKLASFP